MNNKGSLIVVSGFSGAGKGTITRFLLEKYPQQLALSVSATTRAPRVGEEEGIHYFFKTKEEFDAMIENDEFIEYAQYVSNSYGTPKAYVEKCLSEGKDVILEIDVQGGLAVKEKFPEAISFWITAPDAKSLKERLIGRGTETLEVIENRMKRAAEESTYMNYYDYLIVNDIMEDAAAKMYQIIQESHHRMCLNLEYADKMKNDLENFVSMKGE